MGTRRGFLLLAGNLAAVCVAQDNAADASFSITGRVQHPGKYNLWQGMLIADALTPAGGLLESADDRNIVLIRGRERRKFNYRNYKLGKRPEENSPLENGDVIVVP
jgi:protein involved in polysaccharide export with SLBB domain